MGQVSPETGLRHGTGTYRYSNPFFTYEGDWVDGQKHGQGLLKFSDGGYVRGRFERGQIEGPGERKWADGSLYVGNFHRGEFNGEGLLT